MRESPKTEASEILNSDFRLFHSASKTFSLPNSQFSLSTHLSVKSVSTVPPSSGTVTERDCCAMPSYQAVTV